MGVRATRGGDGVVVASSPQFTRDADLLRGVSSVALFWDSDLFIDPYPSPSAGFLGICLLPHT
jgi:hypothetical protein